MVVMGELLVGHSVLYRLSRVLHLVESMPGRVEVGREDLGYPGLIFAFEVEDDDNDDRDETT